MYTLYETSNTINNKIYVGVHKTDNPMDSYLGSGTALSKDIKKFGKDKFTKRIIAIFEIADEAFAAEKKIVTKEFCLKDNVYNIATGGYGGFDHIPIEKRIIQAHKAAKIRSDKHAARLKSDPEYIKRFSKAVSNSLKGRSKDNNWTGKTHTEETKAKMRKPKNVGTSNPAFGTMWITNGAESRKISKSEPIPEGFKKGRKMSK